MEGGGYTNFLRQVRKGGDAGYLATFIIVDYDRAKAIEGEQQHFQELLKFCKRKNKEGRSAYFLIVDNPDFEYFACLHSPDYKNNDIVAFLCRAFGLKEINKFKGKSDVYTLLNQNGWSTKTAIERTEKSKKIVTNTYTKNFKNMDLKIKVKRTDYFVENAMHKGSNIDELFDIIGCPNWRML